jgi:arginyl-tRNA synthetase
MCSIFAKAGVEPASMDLGKANLGLLRDAHERDLAQQLAEFPDVVARAAAARAPHLICDYLERTAGEVNSWYHAGNPTRNPELAVLAEDTDLRLARLMLALAVRVVLRNGLWILGLTAPERMERDEDEQPA